VVCALLCAGVVKHVTLRATAEAVDACAAPANAIVAENCLPGNPASEWDVSGAGDPALQGFATDISVNRGGTVAFKIATTYAAYRLDIYRMGYYGGLGARKVAALPRVTAVSQPTCLRDDTVGLVDCGNWSVSTTWTVPAAATSGIYFARVIRDETGQPATASHIFFIVRNDGGHSDLLFQTDDTTWHAYNRYGGNSLYFGNPAGRAYKVSYNRPFTTRDYAAVTFVFDTEYPMVRFLEANGYDVSYFTGVDVARSGARLLDHRVFLSVGHDEYWSGEARASVEAARSAGVNLAFFSGNEVFWKTRWEDSISVPATTYRTIVCYKETHAGAKIDPSPEWTGTWRDPRFSPPADGGRPENGLSGTLYMVNGGSAGSYAAMRIPPAEGLRRFWLNTSVRTQALSGATAVLPAGTIGYEWDIDADNAARPAGLFHLSSTSVSVASLLLDNGSNYGSGTAVHSMNMYRYPGGGLVFGAGTVRWAWGLDASHEGNPDPDPLGNPFPANRDMQQATINVLADMGAQPGNLQSGLAAAAASTDFLAPVSAISSPAAGATVPPGTALTISGTASDTGGAVAGIEVSVDGGATWHPASGTTNWTYAWRPVSEGTATLRSRAVDDSANLETPGAGVTITVSSAPPTVNLTFQSVPSGLQLTVGGVTATTPFVRNVLVGSSNSLSAPSPQIVSGTNYQFTSWSDSGAQSHTVVAGSTAQTYTATFSASGPAVQTLGLTTVGAHADGGDSNYLNGSLVTAPAAASQVSSASVYVGAVDPSSANRQYQIAIYTNASGHPGTIVAASASGTLTANAWNTVPLSAALAAGTSYWVVYNSNGASPAVNNMQYDDAPATQGVFSQNPFTFGTWPATFPASAASPVRYSLYVTLAPPDTTPPTVTLASPGSSVSGTVTLSATAADNVGVTKVEFYADGTLLGTDTSSPFSLAWDSSGIANGSHALTAKAYDAAGNVTTSGTVTVTTTNTVATPTISPAGGTFAGSVTVTLATTTPGATLRYTLNGSDPTSTSTVYSAPLTLSASATVKAKAFKTGVTDSLTASAAFTITVATTLGMTSPGTTPDSGDSNYLNGSIVTTFGAATAASMSVYVGAIDASTTNRQFQVAIYTNNGGTPGTLVAKSASGTLVANMWNTITISAPLAANTSYWLIYNTNGRTDPVNDMSFSTAPAGQSVFSNGPVAFGTWPATFPAATLTAARYAVYVTLQ